jgi:hypothetical protein
MPASYVWKCDCGIEWKTFSDHRQKQVQLLIESEILALSVSPSDRFCRVHERIQNSPQMSLSGCTVVRMKITDNIRKKHTHSLRKAMKPVISLGLATGMALSEITEPLDESHAKPHVDPPEIAEQRQPVLRMVNIAAATSASESSPIHLMRTSWPTEKKNSGA